MFAALLVLDERRRSSARFDVCCCFKSATTSQDAHKPSEKQSPTSVSVSDSSSSPTRVGAFDSSRSFNNLIGALESSRSFDGLLDASSPQANGPTSKSSTPDDTSKSKTSDQIENERKLSGCGQKCTDTVYSEYDICLILTYVEWEKETD